MKSYQLFIILFLVVSCGGTAPQEHLEKDAIYESVNFYGNAQGTTFSIICNDSIDLESDEIEKILDEFDLALSGYIDNSMISTINAAPAGVIELEDDYDYFDRCYKLALETFDITSGAFDPTIHPLWTVWDFNDTGNVPDSAVVDSLLRLVGFEQRGHFLYQEESDTTDKRTLTKVSQNATLGFDGIAQGVAVDCLAELLEEKGAENYYVEIGGEIRVRGLNNEGQPWSIAIDKPLEGSDAENREIQEVFQLVDKSVATSGSYRKFFIEDGVKYSHTIDPRTGYPVDHSLLSVSVAAESCGMADALATAFMVMGADSTMKFVKEHPELDLDVYLVISNPKDRMETYFTNDFNDLIIE